METLAGKHGRLKSIKVIDEKFVDGESEKSLKIAMVCEFEKGSLLAYVRFEFSTVRGHLLGFSIPCTAERAGVDPSKIEGLVTPVP